MPSTHPRTRLRWAVAAMGGLALAATLVAAAPTAAVSPTACRVKDLDTGVTKASLQKAHDAARAGHRLTVRGTCAGITTIRKSLVITGTRTATSGKPFLDGKLNGTVVTVRPGVKVAIRDLTIRNGATDGNGGGILNRGTLVLRDVVVRGNTAYTAGGVFNEDRSTLTLKGTSSIRGNAAGYVGGGVHNFGALTLNGRSSIRGNTATYGGGVHNEEDVDPLQHVYLATLTLNDSSSITGNTAGFNGGGVFNDGMLKLKDSSRISQNIAGERGGGVYHDGLAALRMRGSSAITGNDAGLRGGGVYIHGGSLNGVRYQESDPDRNNVRNNTPDNVLDVMLEAQSES